MQKLSMAAAIGAALIAWPAVAGPDEPAGAIRTLLAGWFEGDAAKAASVLSPDFRLATLRKSETGEAHVDVQSRESLVAAMHDLKPGSWDVHLGAISIRKDSSGIATAWAPYTFYLNGRKSHCGVETFQLYRLAAGWQIASFADTHLWDGTDAACPDRPR